MASIMYIVAGLMMTSMLVQADECSHGSECLSDVEPKHVMSLLQRDLQMNMVKLLTQGMSRDRIKELVSRDPTAMLTELEEMVRSGETPPFDVVATIKSLVHDDLIPQIAIAHQEGAKVTTEYLNKVQECNDDSKNQVTFIAGDIQTNVINTRSQHSECREGEQELRVFDTLASAGLGVDDAYCAKSAQLLQNAHNIASQSIRETTVQYVEFTMGVQRCGQQNGTSSRNSSADREVELKNKVAECRMKQAYFELGFCIWNHEVTSNCQVLDRCHARQLTAYNDHVVQAQANAVKWNVEIVTMHKILCYCDVWLRAKDDADGRDGRSQINATQFAACKDTTHVPDQEPADYGTPAEKILCETNSVAKHPGTPAFITQEYSNFTELVEPVVPCLEVATSTTVAPSTTQ